MFTHIFQLVILKGMPKLYFKKENVTALLSNYFVGISSILDVG